MQKRTIIVSGKNGQLGNELQDACRLSPQFSFQFFSSDELNISDKKSLEKIFSKYQPSYFINAAAYTAVDKAESEQELAYLVNAEAVGNIARACKMHNTKLIHLSTDYVFNGKSDQPYKEDDATDPINYYGYSKWMGEQLALENCAQAIIIRTSWVYSIYGHNFVKTMLRLMNERKEISVVNDQIGSPTYAKDIAEAILKIIGNGELSMVNFIPGVYHFSNEGTLSWYEFAKAIKEIKRLNCMVHPIPTSKYPTPAKRPAFSVMSKKKIQKTFGISLNNWKQSLEECLSKL
jgi:dTDP-4-dehydrorhamnose reductase